MPRPCHCRRIGVMPKALYFSPCGAGRGERLPENSAENILGMDCLEAMRLSDYLGLGTNEAAMRMGISRHTFGRLLRRAHYCVARAICEGQGLRIAGAACALSLNNCKHGDSIMSESVLVAVPSDAPGGLEAAPSAHFGHCAAYTVARVEDGAIKETRVVPNKGHEHGGCVQPVQELAGEGVTALLAGGMGMRPLSAMHEAGINVYYCVNQPTVKDALEAFAAGKLQAFGRDQLCKGHCGHH